MSVHDVFREPNHALYARVPFHVKQPGQLTAPIGPTILFDGVCNLCNAAVLFIIDRDRAGYFRFAALESPAGARLLEAHGNVTAGVDSIVLVDEDGAWVESDAALRIARGLDWPWRAARAFGVIPRPVRDALYRWVARNRYRWFGRRDACRLPTPALAARFLDDADTSAPG